MKGKFPVFLMLMNLILFYSAYGQNNKIDSLKQAFKSEINDSVKVHILLNLASSLSRNDNTISENEEAYAKQALQLAEKINYYKGIAMSNDRLGVIDRNRSNYSMALDHHNLALQYISPYGICREKAIILNNIGVVYRRLDELSSAADFHLRALKIAEELDDHKNISVSTNSLGNIFIVQGNYQEALKYFLKALGQEKESKNLLGVAINLNNIGEVYAQQKQYQKAIEFFNESLRTNKIIGSKKGVSICYNSLGEIYNNIKDYPKALDAYQKALEINEQLGDKIYTSASYINIGEIQGLTGNKTEAEKNIRSGLTMALNIGSKAQIELAYEKLSDLYSTSGRHKEALEMYRIANQYKDSILNEDDNNAIARLKTVYETEKKEREIQSQKLEILTQNKAILKEKALKVIFIGGFGAMILLSLLIFYNYRLKKKANEVLTNYNNDMDEKNRILTMQKEEILAQRDQIEEKSKIVTKAYELIKNKNKNIIENIRYAFQIQNALLPPVRQIKEYFPNSFIMYRPRDIVSGDFYWTFQKDQKLIIAAADCTGHGVSGAFMSILGISSLNEIVNEKGITRPDQILNHLRDKIIWSMQQEEKFWEAKDGIDMTILTFDFNTRKVAFSGANASVFLIRNEEIIQMKGDKMPVSIFPDIIPFTCLEYPLFNNDVFYLYSDGYYHQFGGLYGKKFSVRQFKSLLLKIHDQDADSQLAKLEETFRKWRARNEQVDDILVIGLKITEDLFNPAS